MTRPDANALGSRRGDRSSLPGFSCSRFAARSVRVVHTYDGYNLLIAKKEPHDGTHHAALELYLILTFYFLLLPFVTPAPSWQVSARRSPM